MSDSIFADIDAKERDPLRERVRRLSFDRTLGVKDLDAVTEGTLPAGARFIGERR